MCSQTVTIATRYFLFVVQGDYKWGGPSDKTSKTEAPCHRRCGTIKTPPCTKTQRPEAPNKGPKLQSFTGYGDVSI